MKNSAAIYFLNFKTYKDISNTAPLVLNCYNNLVVCHRENVLLKKLLLGSGWFLYILHEFAKLSH